MFNISMSVELGLEMELRCRAIRLLAFNGVCSLRRTDEYNKAIEQILGIDRRNRKRIKCDNHFNDADVL